MQVILAHSPRCCPRPTYTSQMLSLLFQLARAIFQLPISVPTSLRAFRNFFPARQERNSGEFMLFPSSPSPHSRMQPTTITDGRYSVNTLTSSPYQVAKFWSVFFMVGQYPQGNKLWSPTSIIDFVMRGLFPAFSSLSLLNFRCFLPLSKTYFHWNSLLRVCFWRIQLRHPNPGKILGPSTASIN